MWSNGLPKTLDDLFENFDQPDEICKNPPKECKLHIGWGQRFLGMIDNDRMNCHLEREEVTEAIDSLNEQMGSRGDVLVS